MVTLWVFAKFMRAWVELLECDPVPECLCGGCNCEITKRAKEAREKEQRYAFLMGLNKDLSYVITQIMLMDPPSSLHQAFVLVDQAESMMKSQEFRKQVDDHTFSLSSVSSSS